MALLEVLTYPNPILKRKSVKIEQVTPAIVKLAKDMLETMYEAPGVGLAAPQVGELVRMIVIDTRPTDDDGKPITEGMTELEQKVSYPLILINPEVTKKEGKIKWEEGCLSVPGYVDGVERAKLIECRAWNEKGEEVVIKTDGLLAVCIQHEIDHLDGKLFIERLSTIKTAMIKNKIKKHGYPDKKDKNEDVL